MRNLFCLTFAIFLSVSCGGKESLKTDVMKYKPTPTESSRQVELGKGLVAFECQTPEEIVVGVYKKLYKLVNMDYLIETNYFIEGESGNDAIYYLIRQSGKICKVRCKWNGNYLEFEKVFYHQDKYYMQFDPGPGYSQKSLCFKVDMNSNNTQQIDLGLMPRSAMYVNALLIGDNTPDDIKAHEGEYEEVPDETIKEKTGLQIVKRTLVDKEAYPDFSFYSGFKKNGYIFVSKGITTDGGAIYRLAFSYLGIFRESTWEKIWENDDFGYFINVGKFILKNDLIHIDTGKKVARYQDIYYITQAEGKVFMFATENGVRKLVALNIDKLDELVSQ